MPKFTVGLIIVFLVFAAGIADIACLSARKLPTSVQCRNGLLVVEQQPDTPVRISILDTNCPNPYFANVRFQMEERSARPISRYEVRMSRAYDGNEDGYSTVVGSIVDGSSGQSLFSKDQQSTNSFGVSLRRGWFKDPEAKLTLSVWSVSFSDGTVWNRTSPVQ